MRLLNLSYLTILASFLLLAGCKKRGTFEVPCKIAQFVNDEGNTVTFSHNVWGDPTSIIVDQPSTGKPNLYFKYDNQHRLTSLLGTYEGMAHDHLVKYKYDGNNFIVSDTFFYSGYGTDPYNGANYYGYILRKYTYDTQGRVIRIDNRVGGTTNEYANTYSYDAQGNRVNGLPYDNKTSYLRTSLVLAFINQNYSMNNPATAVTYNSKKLPTLFAYPDGTNGAHFLNHRIVSISYTCDSHDD
jgi:hypothetical protein